METQPVELDTVFGFSCHVPGGVVDLRTNSCPDVVCYAAGHTFVVYDRSTNQQKMLQGHIHQIQSLAADPNKNYILTADTGPEAVLILWNRETGQAMKAVSQGRTNGIVAIDISSDGFLFATLSAAPPTEKTAQELSIWDIGFTNNEPLCTVNVPSDDFQTCVHFNTIDKDELITNGRLSVFFWRHCTVPCAPLRPGSPAPDKKETKTVERFLEGAQGKSKAKDLKCVIGDFTVSIFSPNPQAAITATVDGDLVLWGEPEAKTGEEGHVKDRARRMQALKAVRLHNTAIRVLSRINQYITTGAADGYVRFYEARLGLVAWFEQLHADLTRKWEQGVDGATETSKGEIVSISFSSIVGNKKEEALNALHVPPFTVGTKSSHMLFLHAGLFEELPFSPVCKGEKVMKTMPETVTAVATHPSLPHFATISPGAGLQICDYSTKKLVGERDFAKLHVCSVAYSPLGTLIACGFTNGILKLVRADFFEDLQSFSYTRLSITQLEFSKCGTHLCTADASFCVALISYKGDERWECIGKYRSHARMVAGVHFAVDGKGLTRLFSIGHDTMLVEYDVLGSAPDTGLKLKGRWPLNPLAHPTSVASCRSFLGELQLIIGDEGYKVRIYDTEFFICRKTFLGPAYGSPVCQMLTVSHTSKDYILFSTREQVIGLMSYPSEGKKNLQILGVIAHPGIVSSAAVSYDSKYILTTSGLDSIVNLWRVNLPILDSFLEIELKRSGPYGRLSRAADAAELQAVRELFFCAQIRTQGEDSPYERHLDGSLPLEQIPDLLRGLGMYPSNSDIEDILVEIRQPYINSGLDLPTSIEFEKFATIFSNHRPVFPFDESHIYQALVELGADPSTSKIDSEPVLKVLQAEGEVMSRDELENCLSICLQQEVNLDTFQPEIDSTYLAHDVLEFEEYT